jgi:dihydropyrimidinase
VTSTTPARMFGMYGRKGVLQPGADGDVVVYDPNGRTSIGVGKTHHMNMDYSAWEGWEIDGHVDTVVSRGKVIVDRGEYLGAKGDGVYVRRGLSQYLV